MALRGPNASVNDVKNNNRTCVVVVAALVTSLCLYGIFSQNSFGKFLENAVYDSWLKARSYTPSDRIVLAVIDEKSLDEQGKWSWPRVKQAQLVEKLDQAGARIIAFDMFFPEPDEGTNDATFAQAIRSSKAPVVLSYYFHFDHDEVAHVPASDRHSKELALIGHSYVTRGNVPMSTLSLMVHQAVLPESNVPEISSAADRVGYFNLWPEKDGRVRSVPGVIGYENSFYMPFSVAVAAVELGVDMPTAIVGSMGVECIQLGNVRIPAGHFGYIQTSDADMELSFPSVSVTDILMGHVDDSVIRDKIVIIGATAQGLDEKIVGEVSGRHAIRVHAGIIEAILNGDVVSRPTFYGMAVALVGVLLAGVVTGLFFVFAPTRVAISVSVVLAGAYWGICQFCFMRQGVFYSPVYPVIALCLMIAVTTVFNFLRRPNVGPS